MRGNALFDAWVDRARGIAVADAIQRFPHQLKRLGAELVGPCPACGGRDRFSVNPRKNVWHCRRSGKGGDAIALVEYLGGGDFLGACEQLTGEPPPSGEKGKGPDPELMARRRAEATANQAKRDAEANQFRSREIARAREIWAAAGPIADSVAERYLKHRGLTAPPGAKLRSCANLQYWHFVAGSWAVIHRGPAMVAAIADASQRFIGCHCTWIDPRIASGDKVTGGGKAEIAHPETGELLPAKKVRGSAKGGHVALGGAYRPLRLFVGEGIETVLSVRAALAGSGADLDGTSFWASVSLGNIGGRAAESVAHPHLTRTDTKGRIRRLRVPGPVPAPGLNPGVEDKDILMPPDDCASIVVLGDGDSDRFTTECCLRRGAARWQRPGRVIRMAWADEGSDFNDMWQAEG